MSVKTAAFDRRRKSSSMQDRNKENASRKLWYMYATPRNFAGNSRVQKCHKTSRREKKVSVTLISDPKWNKAVVCRTNKVSGNWG